MDDPFLRLVFYASSAEPSGRIQGRPRRRIVIARSEIDNVWNQKNINKSITIVVVGFNSRGV